MALCRVFGYTKKELIGRNVKSLMPSLIADHHDGFVQRNLERTKVSCCTILVHDIISYALHRTKYLLLVSLRLLSTPNLLNDMQYIAKVRVDKKVNSNTVCLLLLNTKKEVVGVSGGCIPMLNLSNAMLNNYTVNMSIMAPELFNDARKALCLRKGGSVITVFHPSEAHRQGTPFASSRSHGRECLSRGAGGPEAD